MFYLGKGVESVISHAQNLKQKTFKQIRPEASPIPSIDGILPPEKVRGLIQIGLEKVVLPAVSNFGDKSVLEISDGSAGFAGRIKEGGAAIAVHVNIGRALPDQSIPRGIYEVIGSITALPFEDGFFDIVIANLVTPNQGDISRAIREIARVITFGGGAVIVDLHPFGNFAKKGGLRLRPRESIIRGVEDYYKICKVAGLRLNSVREAFIDETTRQLFETDDEIYSFRLLKDTPLLISLAVERR